VVSVLEKRVSRLEQAGGGNRCGRCSGTMIVFPAGSDEPVVNRHGVEFSPEESKRFWAQEQPHGQCPACWSFRQHVRVSWGPRT